MLLDSNIIIYAAQPAYGVLRTFIAEHSPAVSAISYVEVLGYHKLTEPDRLAFESFFAASTVLPITQDVLNRAVALRQIRKMTLGDALVAATALVYSRELITRNVGDFTWIADLRLRNPLAGA
jgi:predicted nucleic acid-binding protein